MERLLRHGNFSTKYGPGGSIHHGEFTMNVNFDAVAAGIDENPVQLGEGSIRIRTSNELYDSTFEGSIYINLENGEFFNLGGPVETRCGDGHCIERGFNQIGNSSEKFILKQPTWEINDRENWVN